MQTQNNQERPQPRRLASLEWWAELNAELALLGEREAGLGDATHFRNYSPMTAARLIQENRREQR